MAGMIRRESIDEVRERARIEEIVGQHVTLKPAGVGSLKGLCPFHDEKTPSFHVRPHVGFYHCFGCGEGGDVITFVQNVEHLSFTEAVERLADLSGVTLRYEDETPGASRRRQEEIGTRHRLVAANAAADEYFREQLASPGAAIGRRFLAERGFDSAAAATFGVGFAPTGWDNLLRHLRGRGFTEQELIASGLATQGRRGGYDRFRGRLVWPIRDLTGTTVGFGARRLGEDDQGPKYLNTPETALYKKSQVLYGLDLAKKDIARRHQAVIVEGYTDVMAAHLAGVTTAVATCGTAFGSDHAKLLRRLLGSGSDSSGLALTGAARGGEVIFTFDGDEAGQKAALRAFAEDQTFTAQTFVAVGPDGLDPCDLRLQRGDEAVRNLVASREPLFRFVVRAALARLDLSTVEGRVAGLRAAAPVVAGIRDHGLRLGYARELAGWLGMDEAEVRGAVQRAGRGGPLGGRGDRAPAAARRDREDPVVRVERQALEVVLQHPRLAHEMGFDRWEGVFEVPVHRAVHDAVLAAGGTAAAEDGATARWLEAVAENAEGPVRATVHRLAVSALPEDRPQETARYARGVLTTLARLVLTRRIGEVKGLLGRLDPAGEDYREVFGRLLDLEAQRRALTPE